MMPNASNRSIRSIYLLRMAVLCVILSTAVPCKATPRFNTPTLYLRADTLTVDLRVDSLFSARTQDAIASGMTTSISYEFLLEPVGPAKSTRKLLNLRLDHDIWEGRYQILRRLSRPDTLTTRDLVQATRYCSDLDGVPLAVLSEDTAPFVLRVRTVVNPISPEQEVKTRRWLNLLERGSVLELFFSLAPESDDHDWVEIARFWKDDLPAEISTPDQPDEPEGESP